MARGLVLGLHQQMHVQCSCLIHIQMSADLRPSLKIQAEPGSKRVLSGFCWPTLLDIA